MTVRTEPDGLQACCAAQALIRGAGEQGAQGSPGLPYIEFASRLAFRMRGHRQRAWGMAALGIFSPDRAGKASLRCNVHPRRP